MSLLDDLKKQAVQENAKETVDNSKTLQRHQINWNTLVPKLQLVITYMRELSENLNVLNIEEKINYPLTKNITFKNLTRGNYRVRKADEKSVRDFSLRYDLVGQRKIEFDVTNDFNAENIRNILRRQNVRFTEVITDKGKVQFKLLPKITILFQYVADVENCLVILRIHNFDRPETQEIKYKPEQVTEELMEETAKYILNKENKFRKMSGNDVGEETLSKLRNTLKKDGKLPTQGNQVVKGKQGSKAPKKSLLGKLLKK